MPRVFQLGILMLYYKISHNIGFVDFNYLWLATVHGFCFSIIARETVFWGERLYGFRLILYHRWVESARIAGRTRVRSDFVQDSTDANRKIYCNSKLRVPMGSRRLLCGWKQLSDSLNVALRAYSLCAQLSAYWDWQISPVCVCLQRCLALVYFVTSYILRRVSLCIDSCIYLFVWSSALRCWSEHKFLTDWHLVFCIYLTSIHSSRVDV